MEEPMSQTYSISIDQAPGQTNATFNPQNLAISVGDIVFWRNNTSSPHQPKPPGGANNAWVDEIPGKLPDQPAPTSRQVTFGDTGTYNYVCAFHSQETGSIAVS
jgi:plastocyanin